MAGYIGIVALNSAIDKAVISKNSSGVPTDADAAPSYRIYGPSGFMASGSLTNKDTGSITNCPPANPTVYTSQGHGLTVGTKVTVASVGGNTGANTTGDVTAVTSNTFTIAVDTSGGSAYTSGGTWHATGVYDFTVTPTVAASFASGVTYSVYVFGKYSTVTTVIDDFVFQVS